MQVDKSVAEERQWCRPFETIVPLVKMFYAGKSTLTGRLYLRRAPEKLPSIIAH